MSRVRAGLCAIAVGLLLAVFALPLVGPADSQGAVEYVRIQVPGADAASLGPDVEIVETYDSFVLAKAPASARDRLAGRGISVLPEDTFTLSVNGYAFDTREDVTVPAAVAASAVLEGHGYYIVQLLGPVKDQWKWELERHGLEIVNYVPNNAFVVRAEPAALAALDGVREVQWVGHYHPAFRIAPELLSTSGTVTVDIIAFAGEPVGAIVSTLNKMGFPLIGRRATGEGILALGQYEDFGLVRARIPADLVIPISHLRMVRYIEPYVEPTVHNGPDQFVLQTNASAEGPGVRRIWDMGIRGEGQIIGVSDSGLDYDHAMFRHGPATTTIGDIYNLTDLNRRKTIRYLPMSGYVGVDPFTGGDADAIKDSGGFCGTGHGTSTSSAAAGDDAGIGGSANDGMARLAKLIMADIGTVDASCQIILAYIPDDYKDLFGDQYDEGARILTNSWGAPNSAYTIGASQLDRFTWENRDALIFYSAGNAASNPTVGSPATAKNVVAVSGASSWMSRENMGPASIGPTNDGRRKPDVTTFFNTAAPGGTALSDGNLNTRNGGETGFGGTSYASPLAAGMAALARQYFTDGWYPRGSAGGANLFPSGALLKGVMAATSVQMVGTGTCLFSDPRYPNIAQGFGRIWLDEALYFSGDTKKLFVVDHTEGTETGVTLEYKVRVASPAGGLRVVLSWADPPALEGASPALINNLNLEVTDPTGNVYRGNVFGSCAQGQNQLGGTPDTLNNLEAVIRKAPAAGDWTIRIIGANVPIGPQPFGLAVIADLDQGYGIVTIDKVCYGETDFVNIRVEDGNAGTPTVDVVVTSQTEPAGETATLTDFFGSSWVYLGMIPTDYGQPTPGDGMLQVSHGDTITVTYNDPNPPHASIARACVEIDAPMISNVRATGITNADATIRWDTDKPANSTVYYGTNPASLDMAVGDNSAVLSHAVLLTGLTTETLYFYDVESTRAGHTVRDDNGGRHYAFKTTEKAEILLVVGDATFTDERVAMYRDALASASWSWNEWHVDRAGDPPLATLQDYKAILWQAGLEQYPPLTDPQRTLIRNYVDGGGRILFSGHDYAWAFCDVGSAYRTAARCQFFNSVMKANYLTDPATWTQQRGILGDPISDIYRVGGSPGPQPYIPHRSGGSGDEVAALPAGGTTTYVWQTNTGSPTPDDAVKWISSANNGSASPGCQWCGAPSRIVSYLFEFTGINFVSGLPTNPARTDILNKTIVWLLGRAPPTVRVVSPNGGETITANPMTVTWTRSQPLSSQEIYYSRDGGQSWFFVKNVGSTNASDPVDITNVANWPNGCRYRIRVVALDTGAPALKAQDASDNTFCISRAGGDLEGPPVVAGSLRVSPNPARENAAFTIRAVVDDMLRGESDIQTAEFFVGVAPGANGTGTPMGATDLGFDTPTEAVDYTYANAPWAAGNTETVWVHGQDAAGNWGPFSSLTFIVIPDLGANVPNPPTNVFANLVNGNLDVQITWTIPGGPAVDRFEVYFGTLYDPTGTTYALLPGGGNIPPTQSWFNHTNAGITDANPYFYVVRAVNAAGGTPGVEQGAKFIRSLAGGGWQLLSVPITLQNPSISATLQTLNWRTARTYVASDPDPWKARYASRNSGDLSASATGMALWVDLAAPGDFVVAGQVPAYTLIPIQVGWNFVGYPSFISRNAATAFTGLGVTMMEGYLPSPPYFLQRLTIASTTLQAGFGYWVYSTTGGTWNVTNS